MSIEQEQKLNSLIRDCQKALAKGDQHQAKALDMLKKMEAMCGVMMATMIEKGIATEEEMNKKLKEAVEAVEKLNNIKPLLG